MYLSRVKILAEQPEKLAEILQADQYQLHQTLWRLFPERNKNDSRNFLFKRDDSEHFPLFYLLSAEQPQSLDNILKVETKVFNPQLNTGDQLAFSLRANPVIKMPNDKTRHDVVMHLKKSLTEEQKQQYSQANLEQQAGEKWLEKRAEINGFRVHSVITNGYQKHQFKKPNVKKGIKLSSLDFEGILEITEVEKFKKVLYEGIGSAKAFGFGLFLIKRYLG